MIERCFRYLTSAGLALRLVDVIDVLLISVFIYVVFVWISRAHSRWLIGGLGLLGALYGVASALNMHLTTALFQGLIAVAAVVLVVLFQDQIRRGVERMALVVRDRHHGDGPADETVQVLVSTLGRLARARTGALVVLVGHEPWLRHISGGGALGGRPCAPLFESLFDANSPGHDGAVLIERNRVTSFGVHLPLSSRITGREAFGTRHAAALGLAERCDALVLVVSEERGELSVASDGRLDPVASPGELERRIEDFRRKMAPVVAERWGRRFLTQRLPLKILSAVVAVGLWLIAFGYRNDTAVRTISVPVVVENLTEGWEVDGLRPIEVRVALSGPLYEIERLSDAELSVSVDVQQEPLSPGAQRVLLTAADVNIGEQFTVQSLRPNVVRFSATQRVEERLGVAPTIVGELPAGLVLEGVTVEPETVRVFLRRPAREVIESIATTAVDLSEVGASTSIKRRLVWPKGFEPAESGSDVVTVHLRVARAAPPPDAGAGDGGPPRQ
jgi:DNA integrity scanning protein DisA with diadenylate cyclase activity